MLQRSSFLGIATLVTLSSVAGAQGCFSDPAAADPPSDVDSDHSPSHPQGPGDGGAGDEASPGDAPRPPSSTFVDYDINHVLVTGQSNSVAHGTTPLTTTQPYGNLMFDTGVMSMDGCDRAGCTTFQTPTSFVPLVEGDHFFPNDPEETVSSSLANQATMLALSSYGFGTRAGAPAKHDILASLHGRSGNTYWCLRKHVAPVGASWTNGACNYKEGLVLSFDQGLKEVEAAKSLAGSAGKSYVVRAVAAIHGESDDNNLASGRWEFPLDGHDGTPSAIADYARGLVEWQSDYEASVKAITGQSLPVPLFVSQLSGWNHGPYSRVAYDQLEAHKLAPGKVVLIGPTYMLAQQGDCRHFTSEGQRWLGEYFGKVYARVVIGGETWEPVRPKSVTRADAVITVQFHVPRPPLVFDATLVAQAAHQGFTYVDDSGAAAPTIANVAITAPDTVQITLSAAPTGGSGRIRYAFNQVPGTCQGTPFGARGNLRDSDDTPSKAGNPLHALHNWAVHFDEAVP